MDAFAMHNTSRLILAAALVLPLAAHAAFGNGEWESRKKINFDTAAVGIKETVALLPVPVRLHTGNTEFAKIKADGSDLRAVAADDKTPLKQTLEFFDPANELGLLWVQVPKLAAGEAGNEAWLYHGNPKAEPAEGKGAFDGYSFVFHFSENGQFKDASGNGNHPREANAIPGRLTHLGLGAAFAGAERLILGSSPTLRVVGANGFSYSAWIKPNGTGGYLYQQKDGTGALSIGLEGGNLVASAGGSTVKAAAPLTPGNWHHVAVTWGGGRLTLYADGAELAAGAAAVGDLGGEVILGAGFQGDMDEVAVAPALRSAEFVRLQYLSQQADSPLISLGEGGEGESGGHSTFGILIKALTPDALVVIIILAFMGLVSFAVMGAKAMLLARTEKANDLFLDRFRESADTLLAASAPAGDTFSGDRAIGQSSVYRLYRVGVDEMRKRFAHGRERLSGASLDAVRASIDAALVRENHKLNARIVLLTIAISGGPFLGLLGTVVGVMITFAEIAAAGDVNVNAIAPGIAAALVATVAGLAVAIPSLFGYNWLASRIKNISADMQVFADEFITRAAEMHTE
jgi:biopolymer transport protein ExbB